MIDSACQYPPEGQEGDMASIRLGSCAHLTMSTFARHFLKQRMVEVAKVAVAATGTLAASGLLVVGGATFCYETAGPMIIRRAVPEWGNAL